MAKLGMITGAANGIGYEISKLLLLDSYQLILVDKDPEKLQEVKAEFSKLSEFENRILVKDLNLPNAAHEIFQELSDLDLRLDVLVNNAGFGVFGTFSNTNWKDERDMIHLHVLSATHLCKLFLPQMIKCGKGKILNVASIAAFQPGPLMSVYYATKAYLVSFSIALANELKGTGVSVTVLCPGITKTKFQQTNCKIGTRRNWNITSASSVAKYAIKAMNKNKVLAIPGLINRLLANFHRFIPVRTAASIVRKLQEKNNKNVSS